MGYDFVFDSQKKIWGRYYEEIEIDRETNPTVSILFEREGIVLYADYNGNAKFCDLENNVILKDKAKSTKHFSRIHVRVNEKEIVAEFPITEWIDHYPNCDGEYDRWSERILETIAVRCSKQQHNTKSK